MDPDPYENMSTRLPTSSAPTSCTSDAKPMNTDAE